MNTIEDFVREFERKYPGFIDNAQRYVNNWFSKVKNTVLSEKEQEIVERYRHPEMVKASDLMPQGGIKSTGSKRQNSKKKVKGTGVLVPNYPSFESWEQMVKLFPFIVKGWLQDGTIKPGDPIYVYLTKLPAGPMREGKNGKVSDTAKMNYYDTVKSIGSLEIHNVQNGTAPKISISPCRDKNRVGCRTGFNRNYAKTNISANFKINNGPNKPDRYSFTNFGSATTAMEYEIPFTTDPDVFDQNLKDAMLSPSKNYMHKGLGRDVEERHCPHGIM